MISCTYSIISEVDSSKNMFYNSLSSSFDNDFFKRLNYIEFSSEKNFVIPISLVVKSILILQDMIWILFIFFKQKTCNYVAKMADCGRCMYKKRRKK
jgi:hypothetical protein